MNGIQIPDIEEFNRFLELYERNEKRGPDYFKGLSHILQNWGDPDKMAEGVKILLHSWHWNFYRFGDFDFNELRNCMEKNLEIMIKFKNRDIKTLSNTDEPSVASQKYIDKVV
jgi:hypothetical protein